MGFVSAWVAFKLYRTTEPDYVGKTWFSAVFNIFIGLLSWIGVLATIIIAVGNSDDIRSKPPDWL